MFRRVLLLAGSLVSMAAALLILQAQPQAHSFLQAGSPAPDFEARSLAGDSLHLADLRGAPVIINFWATWCGPCALEMPHLQSIFDRYRAEGLRVLAVNTGESADLIAAWQAHYDLSYDLLLDEDQVIAARYWLRGQPSTYLVSPDGVISHIFYGPVSESALAAAVESDLGI